jgi:hypothetical protein
LIFEGLQPTKFGDQSQVASAVAAVRVGVTYCRQSGARSPTWRANNPDRDYTTITVVMVGAEGIEPTTAGV